MREEVIGLGGAVRGIWMSEMVTPPDDTGIRRANIIRGEHRIYKRYSTTTA